MRVSTSLGPSRRFFRHCLKNLLNPIPQYYKLPSRILGILRKVFPCLGLLRSPSAVKSPKARSFYENEALRSGWSVRQLDRQIGSQFYERIALSKNKAGDVGKGGER